MAESFDVTSAALYEQARRIASLADELRGLAGSVGYVELTADAYGNTCQRATSMFDAVAGHAEKIVRAGVDALESANANLRDSADTYHDVDSGSADQFSGISERLG